MNDAVLDSSAILALLLNEPGAAAVAAVLPGALLSTVNLAEIVTKLSERGMPPAEARAAIEAIGVEIVDFSADQACLTGALRTTTRSIGLSLGDRACLALARQRNLPALTADTAWGQLDGYKIMVIRENQPVEPSRTRRRPIKEPGEGTG